MRTLAFNPLTNQIFSGGSADFALWTPDATNIEKNKTSDKINCSAWSANGQVLAYGTMGGTISLRDRKLTELVTTRSLNLNT